MKDKLRILIILLASYQYSNSQSIVYNKTTGLVTIPIQTYRLVVERQQDCDSLNIYNKKLILNQDSIVSLQKLKEQSFKQEISSKDTTIFKLINETNYLLKKEQESKSLFKNSIAWITGCVGLIVGVLIAK